MTQSILNSTKKVLGLAEDYTAFDMDVIMHINTVFLSLNQLGVGPSAGFMIMDDTETWDTYLGEDLNLNAVKTYMFLKVKMVFDPPQTSYLITAMEKQIEQLEFRLMVNQDGTSSAQDEQEFIWIINSADGFPEEAEDGDLGIDENGIVWRNEE